MPQLLASITTSGSAFHTWQQEVECLRALPLTEIALFLTGLQREDRKTCYRRLLAVKRDKPFGIPFVHARSDMSEDEYRFFTEHFGTTRFNLHPVREMPLCQPLGKEIRDHVYVENVYSLHAADLEGFAGICLDLSHLESYRLAGRADVYGEVLELLGRYPVGVSHVSAVKPEPVVEPDGYVTYAAHVASGSKDFAYLARYAGIDRGAYVAIELENGLADQLSYVAEVQAYLDGADAVSVA